MSLNNAVRSVTVLLNGETITLESQDGLTWTKTCVAPDASSFNESGGYYPLTVTATYETGTSKTVSGTADTTDPNFDATLSPQCRLVVKETYRPTITVAKPANSSYFKTAQQPFEFTVLDNANGQSSGFSGVDPSTISVTFASAKLSQSTTLSYADLTAGNMITAVTGGFKIEGNRTFDDSDDWTITVNASDNDGNAAIAATSTFTIDTEAPALSVSAPLDNLKTATATVTISGTTNDSSAGAVVVSVTVDGVDFGTLNVGANGSFSGTITLPSVGEKTIVITATDAAGNATSVTKTVLYDSDEPRIRSVSSQPNPVDNGQTYVITVVTE